MLYYLLKLGVAALVIVLVTELADRSPGWSGLIKSLPLVSLIALLWVSFERRDAMLVADLSRSTLWFVLPSLPFFAALPWLIQRGLGFASSFLLSLVLMILCYLLAGLLARRVGIDLGF